ncbi:hypothetical protein GCM10027046_18290 [Uliginosibacterium flavum]|uniref:LapA family protein n=1 Tax=Uliginosibacterium flavum TaxID=1396831 RepID=A0ABV2THI8_9RHOO
MRILIWLLRAALLILLLGFAIKNDGVVTVHAFFDAEWRVPLVLLMATILVAGVLIGASALVGTVFMLRREVARLRKVAPMVSPSTRLRPRSDDASDSF